MNHFSSFLCDSIFRCFSIYWYFYSHYVSSYLFIGITTGYVWYFLKELTRERMLLRGQRWRRRQLQPQHHCKLLYNFHIVKGIYVMLIALHIQLQLEINFELIWQLFFENVISARKLLTSMLMENFLLQCICWIIINGWEVSLTDASDSYIYNSYFLVISWLTWKLHAFRFFKPVISSAMHCLISARKCCHIIQVEETQLWAMTMLLNTANIPLSAYFLFLGNFYFENF